MVLGCQLAMYLASPGPASQPVPRRLPVIPHATGGDRTAQGPLPKFAEHVGGFPQPERARFFDWLDTGGCSTG